MTAGRCHTLLSPVTEESGEEGTNSEVSSPPACRSPSPGAHADTPLNQVLHTPPMLIVSNSPIAFIPPPSAKMFLKISIFVLSNQPKVLIVKL